MLKKLGMAIIMESDLEQAVTFYKKLGLTLKFHIKDQWAEFALGDTKIGLCPSSKQEGLKRTGLVFEVENLKEVHQKLTAAGVEFLHAPVEKVHGIMVSFKDPGDNVIDIYQPTPDKVRDLVTRVAQEGDECCGAQKNCCKADA